MRLFPAVSMYQFELNLYFTCKMKHTDVLSIYSTKPHQDSTDLNAHEQTNKCLMSNLILPLLEKVLPQSVERCNEVKVPQKSRHSSSVKIRSPAARLDKGLNFWHAYFGFSTLDFTSLWSRFSRASDAGRAGASLHTSSQSVFFFSTFVTLKKNISLWPKILIHSYSKRAVQ